MHGVLRGIKTKIGQMHRAVRDNPELLSPFTDLRVLFDKDRDESDDSAGGSAA
jgi:hypothetical protein